MHGETGETVECRVPLIIAKNDMQGYGSAVTYARRYGLMGMAGIAPEDDDGNAAAKAAPKPAKRISSAEMKRQLENLDNDLADVFTEVALTSLWKAWAKKMDDDGWPHSEDEDDETSFRAVVIDKFKQTKARLQAAMDAAEVKDLREPNLIGAG